MESIASVVAAISFDLNDWRCQTALIRPPDIVCRRTYILPGILLLLLSFLRHLISELPERNSTKIGNILESNCDLKTHVEYLRYPPPYKLGAQKPLFGRLCNLMANLTAYIFRAEHGIDNQSSALTIQGSPTWSDMS